MKRKIISAVTAMALALSLAPALPPAQPTAQAANNIRTMENLGRGLIVMKSGTSMYLSWRLLGTEDYSTTYNVYRDGFIIANVADSTNFTDAKGNSESLYQIAPVINGVEGELCGETKQWGGDSNYMDISIPVPAGGSMTQNEINNNKDTGTDYTQSYTYVINDMSTGDLDGDGEYELVVKFMPTNAGESLPPTYTASVILGAYELDGTPLWTDANGNTQYIDLGMNIRANPHGTQFLVYDLDGDGIAEISTKTAQGSIDAVGNVIIENNTAPNYYKLDKTSNYTTEQLTDRINSTLTHVSSNGQVLCGREYYTVFNGNTGAFIDTAAYHSPRTFTNYDSYSTNCQTELNALWGDNFGNRSERYLATVAYLDGTTPYAVEWRGYYHGNSSFGRTAVGAYKLENKKLVCAYTFDTAGSVREKFDKGELSYSDIFNNAASVLITNNPDYVYAGNGNHNIVAADFDEDGLDELASGSLCLKLKDGNLGVKWNYGRGHGDAFHVGRYIKGGHLLYFIVHEHAPYGMSVIDPYNDGAVNADGTVGEPEVLFHEDADGDTGRGIMVKGGEGKFFIDSTGNDYREVTYNADAPDDSDDSDGSVTKNGYTFSKVKNSDNTGYTADMANIGKSGGYSCNSRVYWDGDVYDELLDGMNSSTEDRNLIIGNYNNGWYRSDEFSGTLMNNSTKNNPCLSADIIGDWREEIICRTAEGVRVYSTVIPTDEKIYTLMHDSQYRSGVAAEQTAYNQPPHVSFYMGENMDKDAEKPNITTTINTTQVTPTVTKEPVRTYSDISAELLWQDNSVKSGTSTGHVLSAPYTGSFNVHAEVLVSSGTVSFQLRDSSSNLSLAGDKYTNMINDIWFDGSGTVTLGGGGGVTLASGTYTDGDWYGIDCEVDLTNAKQSITVTNIRTGKIAYSVTGVGIRQNASNFQRIAVNSSSADSAVRNCTVYTGTAPVKGSIEVADSVKAGTSFTPSVSWTTLGNAAPASWIQAKDVSYTLYKDNLYTKADAVLTCENGTVTVPRDMPLGTYIIEAHDNVLGYAYKKIEIINPEPIRVSDSDIVLELNSVTGADISSDIYKDTSKTQAVTKAELGIAGRTSVMSVLAKISSAGKAEGNYKIDSYSVKIEKNDADIASVEPTVFEANNGICMSQFAGGIIEPGEYNVTVTLNIDQDGAKYSVSRSGNITVNTPAAFDEYYYTAANGARISVFVK